MAQHHSVSGGFTATGQSASFIPDADPNTERRYFGAQISGTFVGTVTLEVQFDGTNWASVDKADMTAATFTAASGAFIVESPVAGAAFRWNCTAYTSGTASYWMGQ